MKGKRVLFVSHVGVCGGAELILLDAMRAFEAPTLFIFEDGPLNARAAQAGAHVIVGGTGSLAKFRRDSALAMALPLLGRMARLLPALARAAARHDLIYANSQKAFAVSAVAAAITRKPLVWHLHDILTTEHFSPTALKIQVRLANRFATLVIAPSQAVAEAFVAGGGDAARILVVPNGLDAEGKTSPEALRAQIAPNAHLLIGVFSRLAAWKGQHVVIRALAELPNVECLIAGGPMFGEDDYARSLDLLVRDLKLASRVHMLGHREDVFDLMRCVDIVVHPSVAAEPFGRTLVEGMLAQKPVIATSTGAASEILAAGETGILVPPGNAQALAQAIRSIADGTPASAMMGLRARQRALETYSAEQMRRGLAAAVGRVLGAAQ
jgi:glycosyltransferase involved in cell wall biosynthesis